MRLIMVSGDFPPRISGVGDYAWHVTRTASMKDIDVTVITTECKAAQVPSQIESVDVRRVMDTWQFYEAKRAISVLSESNTNTIVNIQYNCLAYGRRLMINFLPVIIRILHPRIRIVVTIHGFWEQSLLFRLRTLPMLRAAHGIIYVDRLNKVLISKYSGLPESRIRFMPIAGNITPIPCTATLRNVWRHELAIADNCVVVAFFGGIGRNKGFEYLVAAVEQVRKSIALPILLLAISGFHSNGLSNKYELDIRDLIRKLRMEDCVRILDSPDSTMVSKCLHAANLAVYPFLNGVGENSGSMLAALAHGLPAVVTAGPANDTSFAERFGVLMVPPRDAEQLAKAIEKIIISPELQQTLRDKALKVSQDLNWDFITSESISFFTSLF